MSDSCLSFTAVAGHPTMPQISVNDLKNGITLELDNGLFQVVEFQHVKPGKGGAFVRTKIRNVKTGAVIDKTFNAGIKVEQVVLGPNDPQASLDYHHEILTNAEVIAVDQDPLGVQGRIVLDHFPEDWKYYTLTFPVAMYKHLSMDGIIDEMISCDRDFYSMPRILRRVWSSLWQRRNPLISLVGNFSYRNNLRLNRGAYADFKRRRGKPKLFIEYSHFNPQAVSVDP